LFAAGSTLRAETQTGAGGEAASEAKEATRRAEKPELAIGGYDPVAYHLEEEAIPGEKDITTVWKGKKWRFAKKRHLFLFRQDPSAYAPAYGGNCPCMLARKETLKPGDPQVFRVEDGQLYLFHDKDRRKIWRRNVPEIRKQARENAVTLFSREF